MNVVDFRGKVMLCCLMVLVFFMSGIFLRLGTRQVLVKRLGMDNAFTQMVLFDRQELQVKEGEKKKNVDINWAAKYPFYEQQAASYQLGNLLRNMSSLKLSIKKSEKEKIDKWCRDYLAFYSVLVEAGRGIDNVLAWDLMTPGMDVYRLQDGYLTYSYRKLDMAEHIGAVAEFAQLVSQQGGRLLYVQSPGKTNPFGDRELDGLDYANYNTDMLLQGLQARGVDIFDLRQDMYRDMGNEGWHKAFFRTDHHWLPSTALWAAEKLAARLHADYDVDVDFGHFSEADYDVVNYENYFLGSQGKKVTLAKTTAEDIALYYPKFSTDIRLEIPSLGIDTRGDFTIMYDMERVKKRDFYGDNPYAAYGYGDIPEIKVHNFTNEHLRDKKILIIRDSMVDTVLPFLSMGLKDITLLDIRHFNGSVRRYVEDCKPDIVIVMYKPSYVPIVWNHKDKFDFR